MVPRYSKRQLLVMAQLPGFVMILAAIVVHWLWLSVAGAVAYIVAMAFLLKYDRRWLEERRFSLLEPARQAIEAVAGPSHAQGPKVDLVMESRGDRPVKAIKALRETYVLTLKDAHDMIERPEPWVIKKRVPQAEGEFVKTRLESAGAAVRLVQRS